MVMVIFSWLNILSGLFLAGWTFCLDSLYPVGHFVGMVFSWLNILVRVALIQLNILVRVVFIRLNILSGLYLDG